MAFSTDTKVEATPDILHDSGLVAPADLQQAFNDTAPPDPSKAAPVARIATENNARQALNKESIEKIDGTLDAIQRQKDPNSQPSAKEGQPNIAGKFAVAAIGATVGSAMAEPIVGSAIAAGMTAFSIGSVAYDAFRYSTSGGAESRGGDRAKEKSNDKAGEGVYRRNATPADPTKGGGTFGVTKDIAAFSRDMKRAAQTPGGIIERVNISEQSMNGVAKLSLEVQLEESRAQYVRSMQNYTDVRNALGMRDKGIPVDVTTAAKNDPDMNIKFTVPERPLAFNI